MYSDFVDDVIFSHNGIKRAESVRRYLSLRSPGGDNEAKYAA